MRVNNWRDLDDYLNIVIHMNNEGLLKKKEKYLGFMLFEFRKIFFSAPTKSTKSTPKEVYKKINALIMECNSKQISKYLAYYRSSIEKNGLHDTVLNFEEFIALSKRASITPAKISEIKSEIEKFYADPWRDVLGKIISWPTTEIHPSVSALLAPFIDDTGVLSTLGYRVGRFEKAQHERRETLESIINSDLSGLDFSNDYLAEWGGPKTIKRLMKTAHTMAALCRNAKRSKFDYSQAIASWESDLEYLKEKYYNPLSSGKSASWPKV